MSRSPYLVLFALFLVAMLSVVDRTALAVVQEPIRLELGLNDWQLGLLSGPAFAGLYAVMGLPLARIVERTRSRSLLISACVAGWSIMTMCCGLATTYWQLLLARAGVSIGESGSNPAAHSLIADTFPPERRGRAVSIYTSGGLFGIFIGASVVGALAVHFGWRRSFLALGACGVIVAAFIAFAIPRHTPRGRFDEAGESHGGTPALGAALRLLWRDITFRLLVSAASLIVLVMYTMSSFLASFLTRVHGLDLSQAGFLSGIINGIAAIAGTFLGGFMTDRLIAKDLRWYGRIPGIMAAVAAIAFVMGLLGHSVVGAVMFLSLGTVALSSWVAPTFAVLYRLTRSQTRATAVAIFYMIVNLAGLGVGPPVAGFISDRVASAQFVGDYAKNCRSPTAGFVAPCLEASSTGLTVALAATVLILFVSMVLYWRIGERQARDAATVPDPA